MKEIIIMNNGLVVGIQLLQVIPLYIDGLAQVLRYWDNSAKLISPAR